MDAASYKHTGEICCDKTIPDFMDKLTYLHEEEVMFITFLQYKRAHVVYHTGASLYNAVSASGWEATAGGTMGDFVEHPS